VLKGLFSKVTHVLRGTREIDDDLLDDLEEALVQADVSAKLAVRLVDELRTRAENIHVEDSAGLENVLRQMIHNMLRPLERPLNTGPTAPTVFLIAGVNGVGKTTSIAKIGNWYRSAGNDVLFIAADTYRAAAADQLDVWARRVNCDIVRQQPGADPGAVVHDGLQAALSRKANLVIIDTAGRLHTKVNLMEELKKVVRVVERVLGRPPDESHPRCDDGPKRPQSGPRLPRGHRHHRPHDRQAGRHRQGRDRAHHRRPTRHPHQAHRARREAGEPRAV
jgi:fused signal recognition particle receptor